MPGLPMIPAKWFGIFGKKKTDKEVKTQIEEPSGNTVSDNDFLVHFNANENCWLGVLKSRKGAAHQVNRIKAQVFNPEISDKGYEPPNKTKNGITDLEI